MFCKINYLNEKSSLQNVLNREARDTIWIPTVAFNNTRSKSSTEDDDKALATVALMGEFRRSPNSEAVSSRRFSGSDNPLTISRVYDLEFLCRFDMSTYPFGEQRCSMVLVMRGNQVKKNKRLEIFNKQQ